jgi:hypothetical protein
MRHRSFIARSVNLFSPYFFRTIRELDRPICRPRHNRVAQRANHTHSSCRVNRMSMMWVTCMVTEFSFSEDLLSPIKICDVPAYFEAVWSA